MAFEIMKAASVSSWKMIEFVSVWKFNWCFERRTSEPFHLPARLSSLTRTNLQRIGWSRCRWLVCVFEQTFRILEWVCESLTGWGLASTEAYFYSDVLQEAEVAFSWVFHILSSHPRSQSSKKETARRIWRRMASASLRESSVLVETEKEHAR